MGPGQGWSLIILYSFTFGHNKWMGGSERKSGHHWTLPSKVLQLPKKNPTKKQPQKAQHRFHTKGPKACEAGLILEHTHRICLHNFLDLESFLFSLVRKAVQIYHVK